MTDTMHICRVESRRRAGERPDVHVPVVQTGRIVYTCTERIVYTL